MSAPITDAADRAGDTNTTADTTTVLAEHAREIRRLGRQTVDSVVEIGRRLVEAKALVKRGQWLPWLEQEFGWSEDTAANHIKLFKLTQEEEFVEYRKFRNLNIGVSALYLIGQQSTPEEARVEIIERAKAGEVLPVAEVKSVIKAHKMPATPKKPRSEATPAAIAKTEAAAAPGANGNDIDPEESAARRKAEAAADEAADEQAPTKPSAATKSMSKGEKKRRARYALLVGCTIDSLQDIIDALQLVINALDDNAELVAGQGAQLDQLLAKARELDELVQRARAKQANGGGQS